jgi:riboflavin transporter FmnP
MNINSKTRFIATTGMLSAISAALMFFEFPLPFLPPFLKLDLSDVPVLIGAFVLGPLPALAITLVKDLIHLLVTTSGGVGELADFLVTGSLALSVGFIYMARKTILFSILGCLIGVFVMTIMGVVSNIYIILPFYENFMPIDAILAMCAKINPVITNVKSYIIFGVVPFNLFKGILVAAIAIPVYKRLGAVILGFKK